jgi:uncharacterized protein (TIGR03435 family)
MRTTIVLMMFAGLAWAQPPESAGPQVSFEVASVKPSAPPAAGRSGNYNMSGGPGTSDPGRFACENFDLASLIMLAYDIPSYRLSGPAWMRDTKFDIVANVPSGTDKEQFRLMQQNLLTERFQLKIHWETKEMQVYALVIAKGGSKLKENATGTPMMRIGSTGGITQMTFTTSPVEQFVRQLAHVPGVDRPVLDKTGLTARYDFQLKLAGGPGGATGPEGESVFTAIEEQLGLRLETQRAPIAILVVDRAEKMPKD